MVRKIKMVRSISNGASSPKSLRLVRKTCDTNNHITTKSIINKENVHKNQSHKQTAQSSSSIVQRDLRSRLKQKGQILESKALDKMFNLNVKPKKASRSEFLSKKQEAKLSSPIALRELRSQSRFQQNSQTFDSDAFDKISKTEAEPKKTIHSESSLKNQAKLPAPFSPRQLRSQSHLQQKRHTSETNALDKMFELNVQPKKTTRSDSSSKKQEAKLSSPIALRELRSQGRLHQKRQTFESDSSDEIFKPSVQQRKTTNSSRKIIRVKPVPNVGDLCFGKIRRFCPWPAVITKIENTGKKIKKTTIWVKFFNSQLR